MLGLFLFQASIIVVTFVSGFLFGALSVHT